MSPALHLEASLQREIDRLRDKITAMAALADKALRDCLKALVERDRQGAYAVIIRDQYIDEMEKEVDRLCLEYLVRHQPVARLLRFAYATIRINLELERVGDYAESIARQTLKLLDMEVQIPVERFEQLAMLAIPMLQDAIRSFVDQDADRAKKAIEIEPAVDELKSRLNADLVALFRDHKLSFEALNPLMMIARRFERVSDQARNICMDVLYLCTGEYAKHPGTEVFRILFVDEHNACRSLMAEAVARTLQQSRFSFASAGLDPRPIGEATLQFMKEQGLDLAHLSPKSLDQVPNLDHCHVLVALAPEVRRAFPQRPRKMVYLDWSVKDPSQVGGTPAEIHAAYLETYQFIKSHLTDLLNAILGNEEKNNL
jgi:phosphate transport system protein